MTDKQKTVLVVEDEPDISRPLKSALEKAGFRTIVHESGSGGLAAAKTEMPDLIILDIILPHLDGWQFMDALRADPTTKDLKVVISTNLSSSSRKMDMMQQGVLKYLVKSEHNVDSIVAEVSELLK